MNKNLSCTVLKGRCDQCQLSEFTLQSQGDLYLRVCWLHSCPQCLLINDVDRAVERLRESGLCQHPAANSPTWWVPGTLWSWTNLKSRTVALLSVFLAFQMLHQHTAQEWPTLSFDWTVEWEPWFWAFLIHKRAEQGLGTLGFSHGFWLGTGTFFSSLDGIMPTHFLSWLNVEILSLRH